MQIRRNHVLLLLGRRSCEEVGSYARQTAVRPASDLDLLYRLENGEGELSSRAVLDDLAAKLESGLVQTGEPAIEVRSKTCTVGVEFGGHGDGQDGFSIEIVPAIPDEHSLGRPLYRVPRRPVETEDGLAGAWQISDPFYYSVRADRIEAEINQNFRPAVRLAKSWLNAVKRRQGCLLRSFHLELIVGEVCLRHPAAIQLDLPSLVEATFQQLPDYVRAAPYFLDPADKDRWNDGYLERARRSDPGKLEEIAVAAGEAADTMASLRLCNDIREITAHLDGLTGKPADA